MTCDLWRKKCRVAKYGREYVVLSPTSEYAFHENDQAWRPVLYVVSLADHGYPGCTYCSVADAHKALAGLPPPPDFQEADAARAAGDGVAGVGVPPGGTTAQGGKTGG